MPNTLRSKLKKSPTTRRKKSEEMTLRDLRKALNLTQAELSEKLNMQQETISRLERRSDMLLSTLIAYIEAMGGELSITAKFPNRTSIKVIGFENIERMKRRIL